MTSIRYRPFAAVMFTAALLFTAQATWIPAKAALAQALMAHAWQRSLAGEDNAQPWPWADTQPVGILEIPRLGLEQLVLEGASGRNLAFGPTALTGMASGDLIVTAHRDTHFAALKHIRQGDEVRVTTRFGTRRFLVHAMDVVDSREAQLVIDPLADRLTLVSCWPFDALAAGGPLRYVVTALPAG